MTAVTPSSFSQAAMSVEPHTSCRCPPGATMMAVSTACPQEKCTSINGLWTFLIELDPLPGLRINRVGYLFFVGALQVPGAPRPQQDDLWRRRGNCRRRGGCFLIVGRHIENRISQGQTAEYRGGNSSDAAYELVVRLNIMDSGRETTDVEYSERRSA